MTGDDFTDVDKGFKALLATLSKEFDVDVGFLQDFEKVYADGATTTQVAIWQEFGTDRNIPERPFFRPTIAKNGEKYIRTIEKTFDHILYNPMQANSNDMAYIAERVAKRIVNDVKQAINARWEPMLKMSTIRARRSKGISSVKPLIFSGLMYRSIWFRHNR